MPPRTVTVDVEETRGIVPGCFLDFDGRTWRVVAVDGLRLTLEDVSERVSLLRA